MHRVLDLVLGAHKKSEPILCWERGLTSLGVDEPSFM